MSHDKLFEKVRGPLFSDKCGHPASDYVGSFRLLEPFSRPTDSGDVYYYLSYPSDPQSPRHVCIRFGNEDSEYLSPTNLDTLKEVAKLHVPCRAALQLITEACKEADPCPTEGNSSNDSVKTG